MENLYEQINNLPYEVENDKDYLSELSKMYNDYENILKKQNYKNINLRKVSRICEIIVNAVNYQLDGNIIKAIEELNILFKQKGMGNDLFIENVERESFFLEEEWGKT